MRSAMSAGSVRPGRFGDERRLQCFDVVWKCAEARIVNVHAHLSVVTVPNCGERQNTVIVLFASAVPISVTESRRRLHR
jgi:hypothetical protein